MTQSDPIARFDGKTISYTYDNGTVLATIPSEDELNTTEIISAAISSFVG